MRRKTFDKLVASAGLLIAGLLVAVGGLLVWADNFVGNQVKEQLSAQQIFIPEGEALQDPAIKPYLEKYAGQQLTTGAQAKAYADHYIAVHVEEMTGGKTYAQLSTESRANPEDAKLAGLVETVFKGETLRGMLLNAYAFDTMGTVAGYSAFAAFGGAAALGALSIAGFAHGKRTDESVVLGAVKQPALATV